MPAVDKPAVVITGVSSGIGRGATKTLVENGFHVFGSVRKAEDAEPLTAAFGDSFTPLVFDVTDESGIATAADAVARQLGEAALAGLVNNAGIAVSGPLRYLDAEEIHHQFEVNLYGAFRVTKAFLPLLGADHGRSGKPGRIVMISSVGGKVGSPFLGPYVASKHALEGLSESWRRELMVHGIDVVIVGPGAVATDIWDKAQAVDISRYEDTEYYSVLKRFQDYFIAQGKKGLPPEKIGKVVLEILTTKTPKVRYAVVQNAFTNWILPRLLPKRVVDSIMASRLGLKRER